MCCLYAPVSLGKNRSVRLVRVNSLVTIPGTVGLKPDLRYLAAAKSMFPVQHITRPSTASRVLRSQVLSHILSHRLSCGNPVSVDLLILPSIHQS